MSQLNVDKVVSLTGGGGTAEFQLEASDNFNFDSGTDGTSGLSRFSRISVLPGWRVVICSRGHLTHMGVLKPEPISMATMLFVCFVPANVPSFVVLSPRVPRQTSERIEH